MTKKHDFTGEELQSLQDLIHNLILGFAVEKQKKDGIDVFDNIHFIFSGQSDPDKDGKIGNAFFAAGNREVAISGIAKYIETVCCNNNEDEFNKGTFKQVIDDIIRGIASIQAIKALGGMGEETIINQSKTWGGEDEEKINLKDLNNL